MKFTIQAGAEVELATPKEVKEIVNRSNQTMWEQYTTGGVYRTYVQPGFTLQNNVPQLLGGPDQGFTWSVKRISLPIPTGSTVELHYNDGAPSTYIDDLVRGAKIYSSNSLIVKPGNQLVMFIAAGGPLNVNAVMLAFEEIPVDQEWKL